MNHKTRELTITSEPQIHAQGTSMKPGLPWVSYCGYNVHDELIAGIAQYFELDLIRRPDNEYFSNGYRKVQDSGMFL